MVEIEDTDAIGFDYGPGSYSISLLYDIHSCRLHDYFSHILLRALDMMLLHALSS